jgi:hypothetical protein
VLCPFIPVYTTFFLFFILRIVCCLYMDVLYIILLVVLHRDETSVDRVLLHRPVHSITV